MNVYFESPSFKIGKHHWKIEVIDFYMGGRCTTYLWRADEADKWNKSEAWPRYNINDTYLGLPRTLQVYHELYHQQILCALSGGVYSNPQLEMAV